MSDISEHVKALRDALGYCKYAPMRHRRTALQIMGVDANNHLPAVLDELERLRDVEKKYNATQKAAGLAGNVSIDRNRENKRLLEDSPK